MLNILFIAASGEIDYQCHCLFHGLHELDDVVVYTFNNQPYMFADYPSDKLKQLYGMGFTLPGKLNPQKMHHHSLEKASECIRNHFYDLIVYGSIHRCLELWDLVREYYDKNQIICVDGEDWVYSYIEKAYLRRARFYGFVGNIIHRKGFCNSLSYINERERILRECTDFAVMFKRELDKKKYPNVHPISFAIPKCVVQSKVPPKSRRLAHIIPGNMDTYIYKTERDYYAGYQESIWGMTFKKAGWDCMRHYEILANGCIPYFPDICKCPDEIMVSFPKNIIKYTNIMYENNVDGGKEVDYYLKELLEYTYTYLTTEKLANYVLSFVV